MTEDIIIIIATSVMIAWMIYDTCEWTYSVRKMREQDERDWKQLKDDWYFFNYANDIDMVKKVEGSMKMVNVTANQLKDAMFMVKVTPFSAHSRCPCCKVSDCDDPDCELK